MMEKEEFPAELNTKKENPDVVHNVDLSSVRTTQIGCVLRVLEESMDCVKLSLILPKLLEKPEILHSVLSGTRYEPALRLVDDFMRRRDFIIKEQRPPLSDHGMIKLIDYFQVNHEMYKLFPKLIDKMPLHNRKLLQTFEKLFEICTHRLQRNAMKEINKERKLYKIYQENEAIKAKIQHLQSRLTSQKVRMRWKMAAKAAYLQKCEEELNSKRKAYELLMHNESEKCQRVIRANQKICLERQIVLEEQLKTLRLEFERRRKENQSVEKDAREEKNKRELQLRGIIKKYDHTIVEKMLEVEELQDQLIEAQQLKDALMVTFRKEQAIYNNIVLKREAEEERRRQNAVLLFMMNRAARQIQTYWRKWRKEKRRQAKRDQNFLNPGTWPKKKKRKAKPKTIEKILV